MNNEKEPKVIHVSSTVIIAAIVGLVLVISMLTGTFPMICFLVLGAIIGYFTPVKSTSRLTGIKEFLDREDNYYYKSKEDPEVKIEEKEESKNVSE